MMKICVLGSGSSGNCTYVGTEETGILVDAGMSGKEVASRLTAIGVPMTHVRALCVTHEHGDHTASVGTLSNRHKYELFANSGTIQAIEQNPKLQGLKWSVFETGRPFQVGDVRVEPFSVPHDSYDPVGFVFCHGESRVAVVTDMGMITTLIRERLKRCRALVIEANHDDDMLKNADRPWSLKQRIKGKQGHLSNAQAAELLTEVSCPELKAVFLAHLSSDCNTPELALSTVRRALNLAGHIHVDVHMTYADRTSEVVDV
jgi:phosphoribosyl 1,2-cyclic phosphodiesterase